MDNKKDQNEESFIPELRIELTCNAMKRSSSVGIKSASEAIVFLDGVKKLIDDHMILIFLDKSNVVTGIDAFVHNIDELMKGEPNRALSRMITHFSGESRVEKVIIAQALPNTKVPDMNSINIGILTTIIAKMMLFDIQTVDCVLLGTVDYFSYKENNEAWETLQKELQPRLEFFGIDY